MISDAGFEVEGNALQAELGDAADGAGTFQIPGGGDRLLKPEVARSEP
jgi:hypothetical protein